MTLQKIGSTEESNSTIRVDLNKYLPGCNLRLVIFNTATGLVIFVAGNENGKLKGRQTTLHEFQLKNPLTNQ